MNDIMKYGFSKISPEDLINENVNPFKLIGKDWMLVTAGNENGWNTMTASWGFMGVMWGKNVATTVVRPQRYTKEFIDDSDYFTLSFFDDNDKSALSYCGSHSGRDVDKAKETGLDPIFIHNTTSFKQAKMIIVCKKMYAQEMTADSFIDKSADEKWYADKDYHVQYIGEIVAVYKK